MRLSKTSGIALRSFAVLTALVFTAPTSIAQILQIYSDSVTSYLGGTTQVGTLSPQVMQRGVGVDGALRARPTFAMAIAGNPFENVWTGHESQGELRLDTGAWSPTDVDLALPAPGFRWVVGRTYSAAQYSSGAYTSNGPQGRNWNQTSQPEITRFLHGSDASKDMIYLVYGADRFLEFVRFDATSDEFTGRNGAAGVFQYHAGTPDTYTYTDQVGTVFTFFGFDTTGDDHNGQLWKIVDTANNKAYVGDPTTASTAISSGFDADGRMTVAYDTEGRRYTYTYSSSAIGGAKRLESVEVAVDDGGWEPTGDRVDYTYHDGNTDFGEAGDLSTVSITTPLTDTSHVRTKMYRYWKGVWDDSPSNPGHSGAIKYVYDFEGYRRADLLEGSGLDDGILSIADDADVDGVGDPKLEEFASMYFEYGADGRVTKFVPNGQCGCSAGASGAHEYVYESYGSPSAGYQNSLYQRTIIEQPDGSYVTQYFDETGQAMSRVVSDGDPAGSPDVWPTHVIRNSVGCVTSISTPAVMTDYDHSLKSFERNGPGLVWVFERESSGGMTGFVLDRKYKAGTGGTAYLDGSMTWTSATKTIGDGAVVRPFLYSSRVYSTPETSGTSGSYLTSYAYSPYSNDSAENANQSLVPATVTTTYPIVSSGNNGSNSADVSAKHYRKDGLIDYEQAADGIVTFHGYTRGQATTLVEDEVAATPFVSTGDELQRETTTTYDEQGRVTARQLFVGTSDPRDPAMYYSKLADGRLVTLSFTDVTSGPIYWGPVRFTVTNQAGKAEASGVVALSNNDYGGGLETLAYMVDEGDSDPIEALRLGAVARMSTKVYDYPGTQMMESRSYFLIPGSGAGSDGTNYDPTNYVYDGMGRQIRVLEACGTISRTAYDAIGRVSSHSMGLDDTGDSGGLIGGTNDMVTTEEVKYDGATSTLVPMANSHVTKRTLFVEGSSSGQRVTNYTHDLRGRVIVTEFPTTPYTVTKYDNMGRAVATGLYDDITGFDSTTDPISEDTGRLALTETSYDERGRVWKRTRHEIDAISGSDDDELDSLTWYDSEGRVLKVDGAELRKNRYDRLGRMTDTYLLAIDDDADYDDCAESATLTGDIVLEQHETRYDGVKDDVILSVRVDRLHDDFGANATGEAGGSVPDGLLDTNGDDSSPPSTSAAAALMVTAADLKGRPQISVSWYDTFGRLTNSVELGTFSGVDVDRNDSGTFGSPPVPPTRAPDALRTSYVYNTDGTTQSVEDPRGKKTFWTYDAMGRQTSEVKNWNGNPSSHAPSGTDDNVTVAYEYMDGLRTRLRAQTPTGNQDTVYAYGTDKDGAPGTSTIATGHLLHTVAYPDTTGGTDLVRTEYNARGEVIYKIDQAGTEIVTSYDESGRPTTTQVTDFGADVDELVDSIQTTYDDLGRVRSVVQYDITPDPLDGVLYEYDGWGNLTSFRQDPDSAVDQSGSVNDYAVAYTYATKTTGRNTIRRASATLPSGKTLTYNYSSRNGLYDVDCSRLTSVKDGAVHLVWYDYNGADQVVGTRYNEPAAMSNLYPVPADGTYPGLDAFNRVVMSHWTKDLGTDVDFYHVDLAYDEGSNIVLADDTVHAGFDVFYTMDDVNRLTEAKEGTITWSGGPPPTPSLGSYTRDQQWTLSHTGNWDVDKVDLDGDLNFNETGELNESRDHNSVNELTGRDCNSSAPDEFNPTYDAAGNLTDDKQEYKYEYDAFNRLRRIKETTSPYSLVAEFRYNGLGHKIALHQDTDTDDDVDGSDLWYYDAFDERWRQVARFRGSDTAPKEEFVAHQAGNDGRGGSSYIDLVVCRDKDTSGWTSASDGTYEERLYYCQNWRADVSAIVGSDGSMKEWIKYSAYGVPFLLPAGDAESDGDTDSPGDENMIKVWEATPTYDVRGDLDLDGDVDSNDLTDIVAYYGTSGGHRVLSAPLTVSRRCFAGGREEIPEACLVDFRFRWINQTVGSWISRDPVEYVDTTSLYGAFSSNPLNRRDAMGTTSFEVSSGLGDPPKGPVVGVPPAIVYDNWTSADCCARARMLRKELDLGKDCAGTVICCGARLVRCNFAWPEPGMPDDQIGMLTDCIDKHEQSHKEDIEQEELKNKKKHCVFRDEFRPAGVPDSDASERKAYRVSRDCFKNTKCTTDECKKERCKNLKESIKQMRLHGEDAPAEWQEELNKEIEEGECGNKNP